MRKLAYLLVTLAIFQSSCGPKPPRQEPGPRSRNNRPSPTPLTANQPRQGPPQAQRPSPPPPMETWYPRGRPLSPRWTTIVVHHSATAVGGAAAFDKSHRDRGWDELGYHFVIGNGTQTPDGAIEVGSRWNKQKHGAHCKTPSNYYNDHGIGICLVGDFTRTQPTRRQMASLEKLVRFLSYSCHIPPDRITTHGAVTGKTQCPGNHFALAPIKRALAQPATASSMP